MPTTPAAETRWTIRDVLQWTETYLASHGCPSARLDGEVLLAHCLGTTRIKLYMNRDAPLNPKERAAFRRLVVERANGRPVAYLTGQREFWSLQLAVDKRVLIPRPETELLVEASLEELRRLQGGRPHDGQSPSSPPGSTSAGGEREESSPPSLRVVDVGTGSGCIAIALASEMDNLVIDALDLSAEALEVARQNVERHELSKRISLRQADLLGGAPTGQFHLVVSNPPYVPTDGPDTAEPHVLENEPTVSLLAGPDGLDIYRRLLPQAWRALIPGGICALEVGRGQAQAVALLGEEAGLQRREIRPDLAGIERVVILNKPVT